MVRCCLFLSCWLLLSAPVRGQPDAKKQPDAKPSTATATITLQDVDVGELLDKAEVKLGYKLAGKVTVKASLAVKLDDATAANAYTIRGKATSSELTLEGLRVRDLSAEVVYVNGKLTLTALRGTLPGEKPGEFSGTATAAIEPRGDLTADLKLTNIPLGELLKAIPGSPPVAGTVSGKADFRAAINTLQNPATWVVNADLAADELQASGSALKGPKLKLAFKDGKAKLDADLFGGTLNGSADVPLKADQKGDFKLAFKEIDAKAVTAVFPTIPVRVTGQVTGQLAGTIPVAKANEPRKPTADLTLSSDRLTVQGIPAEKLTGKLSLDGTAVKYELEGKTLGGSFEINGRYPEAKEKEPAPAEKKGSLNVRNVSLARLMEALQLRGVPLRGRVDLSFEYSDDLNDGSGRYTVRGFGYGRERLIPEFGGRVLLRNGQFELADTTGPVAGGTVRARVRARLQDPTRNSFRLDVERADVSRFLAIFTSYADLVEGGVSLTVRGKLYPEFRATGTLSLANGRLAGLTAGDVRVPFTIAAQRGNSQLVVRDATGMIGNGRVAGSFESQWGMSGRLTGQLRFTNVKIGHVLADLNQSNYFGNARATGRIDLSGDNVMTADDLKATVTTTLDQAGVRDLPFLATQVTPFVNPAALLKPFDTGELRGRLSRGVFRIERLTLSNPTADLYADGTVGLNGRLDLAVLVRTGQVGVNTTLIRQIGALATPLPLQVIRAASDFLSNRTVRLTITGTTSSPQTRVNTAALLSEEAIRYLLRQTVVGSIVPAPQLSPRTTP